MGLFRVKIYDDYYINVYSDGEISNIFEKALINNGNPDCIIKKEYCNNNQVQRLLISSEVMLKYKESWVIHSVSCKLKNGNNLVICGKAGSGKSYFYGLLVESGLVEKLYDEDLIFVNNNGVLFSLAKANFKGKVNGEYNYEYDESNFGKIDIFVVMGIENEKNYEDFRGLLINSIMHDSYKENGKLIEHYNKFPVFDDVKYFVVPSIKNQYREKIIYSVIKDIGTIEKKSC